ncbi:MAG: hypothetical protein ACRDSP_08810 [Pseudonocardiaceae bacterium]
MRMRSCFEGLASGLREQLAEDSVEQESMFPLGVLFTLPYLSDDTGPVVLLNAASELARDLTH